jgi:hypothetical protein
LRSSALTELSFAYRLHLLLARDPLELEPPVLVFRAYIRETKKRERFRLPEPTALPVTDSEPPELDQPRLLRMQLQPELREPLAKISQEPLGVLTILKAGHVVIGVAHENDIPSRVTSPPLVGPQVKHVVPTASASNASCCERPGRKPYENPTKSTS